MKLRNGVDIEQIARFEKNICNSTFMERIYTAAEREYIESKPAKAQTAAGIYCAKEAAAKALGRGLYGLLPAELEVGHEPGGVPVLHLHGSALQQYGGFSFSISISHSGDYAIAFCVAAE